MVLQSCIFVLHQTRVQKAFWCARGVSRMVSTFTFTDPPMISPFQNRHIIASSHLTVKCATIPGNPSQTSFRWTRNINNWSQDGETLILPSVTKADAADYTCTALNVMTPTGGYDVDGTDKETFTVNILCKFTWTILNRIQCCFFNVACYANYRILTRPEVHQLFLQPIRYCDNFTVRTRNCN